MATHKIFDGGNRSNSATNQMLPNGTSPATCNPAYSYADHQRERRYGVTKRLDLRARVPYGGGGKDQSLVCYLKDNPIAVGDEIDTHLLLPNTVFTGLSYGVSQGLFGFTFEIKVKSYPDSLLATVNTSPAPINADGCPLAVWRPALGWNLGLGTGVDATGLFIPRQDFVTLKVLTVPAGGLLSSTGEKGLDMWITAHVTDLDHGNA